MKKVLFASTALVAFAGAASAEVTLTGNAELGILSGDGGVAQTDSNVEFFTDIDVTFTMTGETDGGLAFGANIDLDESDGSGEQQSDDANNGVFGNVAGGSNAFNSRRQGGESIFITGAFGTLTGGDTDGAVDWALTEVSFNSGSLNDDETEHAGFNGSYLDGVFDGQIVRYDYSVGDFGVAASLEMRDSDGNDNNVNGLEAGEGDIAYALGVKYQLDLGGTEIGLGGGYQMVNDDLDGDIEGLGFSANTTFLGAAVGLQYFNVNGDGANDSQDGDHYGVGVGYTTGAISLSANYGKFDFNDGLDSEGFGLTAGYDLGGGAALQLGYGYSELSIDDEESDFDTLSFGVRLNF